MNRPLVAGFFMRGRMAGMNQLFDVETLGVLFIAFLFFLPTMIIVVGVWFNNPKHHRFSLRTLLIATTLVAVVLGAIVYLAR